MSSLFLFPKSSVGCRIARFRINEVKINAKNPFPTNEMSEFKGVGLTGVGLTRVDCSLKFVQSMVSTVHSHSTNEPNSMRIKRSLIQNLLEIFGP